MPNHDNKHLAEMPDEILEEIFRFLDIGSKKSFSQVCKKFNQIFGLPRILDRIKFRVIKERGEICDITRQYRHIVESGNLIPPATLQKFTHMISYTKDAFSTTIKANYLVGLLPYLINLNSLDIRHIYCTQTFENQMLQIFEDRKGFEVVEMKHLKTLKIGLKLFLLLNDRFVKFSCSKLTNLKITDNSGEELSFTPIKSPKSLITAQKHLQVLILSMQTHKISEMFNSPFVVCGHLKTFKLKSDRASDRAHGFNSTQQGHLADFLMTQNALENLKIDIGISSAATSKMQHLMNSRLRIPLVNREICFVGDHRANRINFGSFTIDELAQLKKQNRATQHVKLNLGQITPEESRAAVEFVSLSYPNLMSLEIFGYVSPFNGIDAINKLKQLESLTMPFYEFETPSAIQIPTLKKLHTFQHYDDGGDGEWNDVYKTNLNSFFQNQNTIEEIAMEIDGYASRNEYDKMDSEFHEIVENALMQLHSLRKFSISVNWHLINDPDDTDSNKTLVEGWTSSSKVFAVSIQKYANRGFMLQCGNSFFDDSKKLMKTFDDSIVEIE